MFDSVARASSLELIRHSHGCVRPRGFMNAATTHPLLRTANPLATALQCSDY
ncbi:MAG: hypothetical protein M3Z24_09515 [Chloroflexota bacterium]|nr:hypothetical protein [Chloroflexota bacterium]